MDFSTDFNNPASIALLREHLRSLKGTYNIKIVKKSEGRSLQVNKYYRVILTYISDFSGHSQDYLHEYFKEKFIPHVKFREDFILSTTDMTNTEFCEYLDSIKRFMLEEYSVTIPDATEVIY